MAEKISPEDAKSLDPKKGARLTVGNAEVEGQEAVGGRLECPWCGESGRVPSDWPGDPPYTHMTCGGCGKSFRV